MTVKRTKNKIIRADRWSGDCCLGFDLRPLLQDKDFDFVSSLHCLEFIQRSFIRKEASHKGLKTFQYPWDNTLQSFDDSAVVIQTYFSVISMWWRKRQRESGGGRGEKRQEGNWAEMEWFDS